MRATEAPDNVRYAYVNAIALNSEGKRAEALAALRYARQAAVLLPDNANLARLVAELEGK